MTENKLGLPANGADPDELFNKEEIVEVPASEEKETETATSTDVDTEIETKVDAETKEVEKQQEPSEDEKLEIGRVEFLKFLSSHNPEDAEKLAHQQQTGKAGYQQALNYVNVSNPEVVEQWRNEGMLQKTAIIPQPEIENNQIQNQPAVEGEYDPYDIKQVMDLMMTAIRTTDQQKYQNQQQQHQESIQERVKSEAQEVFNQFSTL